MVNADWEKLIDEKAAILFLDVVSHLDLVIYYNCNIDAESEFVERNHGPSIVLDDAFKRTIKDDHSPLIELQDHLNTGDEIDWNQASRNLNLMVRRVMRRRLGMPSLSEDEESAFLTAARVEPVGPIDLATPTDFSGPTYSTDELDRIAELVRERLPEIVDYVRLCTKYGRAQGYTGDRTVGRAVNLSYYITSAELSLFPRSSGYFSNFGTMIERLL